MSAARGVTVVTCGDVDCPHAAAGPDGVEDALRSTIRTTEHGMLVRVGCLLGGCCAGTPAAGRHLLVQPCAPDRAPVGPVTLLGPLHEPADVVEVCGYLGRLGDGPAPAHLVAGVVTADPSRR